MGRKPIPTQIKFFSKVEKTSGCWYWTGGKTKDGYGIIAITIGTGKIKKFLAHRISMYLITGRMPSLNVCHKCDTPSCVNPDHLFEATQQENIADMVSKNRQNRGEKNGMATITEETVREIKRRLAGGETHTGIASSLSISRPLVSLISSGRRWGHVGI